MKLVIFDVDGVMLDTETVWLNAWKTVGRRHGIEELTTELFLNCVGKNRKENERLIQLMLSHIENYEAIVKEAKDLGYQLLDEHIDFKPGLIDLLETLKAKGLKIAVATSTRRCVTEKRFSKLNITHYFDVIVCGDDVTHSKPHPEIYETALVKMNTKPEDALVLEDSVAGVEAAYRAHIPVIMIPDLVPASQKQKDETIAIVSSLTDVKNYL